MRTCQNLHPHIGLQYLYNGLLMVLKYVVGGAIIREDEAGGGAEPGNVFGF